MPEISAGAEKRFHELNPLFVGYDYCSPGHSFGPAVRDHYLLHYIFSGKGKFWVEGKEYILNAGESFLIKPRQVIRYQADQADPWYYAWIGFDGELTKDFENAAPVLKLSSGSFYDIRRIEEMNGPRKEFLTGILFRLYCEIFSDKKQTKDYVAEVEQYIRYNYMSDISIEGLAKQVNIDRRYLSRMFKSKCGKSLKQFLTEVRMEKAEEFLRKGYMVSCVADMVGYQDVCNFSKMFKRVKGKSPFYYREGSK